ncbi:MAG: DUF58 domain-containing protein [Dactylosporangium sp.]|nr:DUF58 domain-containing protein [Dactylosporangium sp.]NNJ60608.1 DUF58 domain-containing protein [Dactylosporangium sp.]
MRMTPRGIGLLLAAAAMIGGGFAFGYAELTMIGTTAVVALGFALIYVAWRPDLCVVRRADPDRVMRGQDSRVTLTVSNASRLRAATLIAHDRCGRETIPVPLLRLRAGKKTTVEYPVGTQRRGVVEIGPLRVVRRDPLGLVTMPRSHGDTDRVWVYPKVYPLAAVPPGVTRSLDGLIDRVPHGTITFDTLREYVIGDELRRVHWRTTARVGKLMVREHLDTSLPRLVLLLDDRALVYPDARAATAETFESACEAAASIILAAARTELPVVLQLVSGPTARSSGRDRDTRPALDLLAEAGLTRPAQAKAGLVGPDPFQDAIGRLRARRLGDTLIYLTGPGRAEDLSPVSALRGTYPTIVIAALGAAEPQPALVEGVLILSAADGETFAAAWDGVPTW